MINKKIICSFVLLVFYSSLTFGINLKLLDLYADSFNGRIWNEIDSPITLIQEKLNFIDESDIADIKKHPPSEADFKTEEIEKEFTLTIHNNLFYYKLFAENCLNVYKNHAEIDELTQAAVSMLFKRVSKKFLEQQKFLEQNYLLTNSKESAFKGGTLPLKDISNSLDNILSGKDSSLGSNKETFILGALYGEVRVYKSILKYKDEEIVMILSKDYPRELVIKLLK